jgi:uncharacterized protein with HEPN domain
MKKSDRETLNYILGQIITLEAFYFGKDEEIFLRDDILKDACMMKLIVIGEYSSKLSEDLRKKFNEVEWQILKSARNFYVHAYGSISWIRVWETLSENIPELKAKIEKIIHSLENESDGKTD